MAEQSRFQRAMAARRAKVAANEDEVIQKAREWPASDTSAEAEYVREVAADIIARRAGTN
jgi:hypothetical protein